MPCTISVVMPVYNTENFLREAIDSILNQTFSDFEFIIIDDASTDGSISILKSYTDPRIRLILKPVNTGYTESLNMGIKTAHGKYIARMDSDDFSEPHRFHTQLEFMDSHPDVVVCGSRYKLLNSSAIIDLPIDNDEIKVALLDNCCLAHPTVMIRRDFLVENNFLYNKDMEPAEDFDLWTRIIVRGKMANIGEPLLQYREHDKQISNRKFEIQKQKADISRIRMLNYLIDDKTELAVELNKMVYQIVQPETVDRLYDAMAWLDQLSVKNNQKGVYQRKLFEDFAFERKRKLVRSFFLQRRGCTPMTFVEYIFGNKKIKGYFTLKDYLKFAVKCMMFR